MDKRGQLVQTFEVLGTIFVVFLLCYVAYEGGSGETAYKAYITKDLALTADAFYINPGEEVKLDYAVEASKYSILIKTTSMGISTFQIPHNVLFLNSESYEFITKEFQSFDQGISNPTLIVLTHSNNLLEVEKK